MVNIQCDLVEAWFIGVSRQTEDSVIGFNASLWLTNTYITDFIHSAIQCNQSTGYRSTTVLCYTKIEKDKIEQK